MVIPTLIATPDPEPQPGAVYLWPGGHTSVTVREVTTAAGGDRRVTVHENQTYLTATFTVGYFTSHFTLIGQPE
jgi:hypothetical protein